MNATKTVLDTPEEVEALLYRDSVNLFDLRNAYTNDVQVERIVAKEQAVEDGLNALARAVKVNPGDADAAYRAVIEKFVVLVEKEEAKPATKDPLHTALIQGRKDGLNHVLYRIRNARG